MRRDSTSPQAYIDDVGGSQRDLLLYVRELVRRVAPETPEGIKYGMLNYPGIASLAAQKQYVALYVDPAIVDRHRADLGDLDCGRSCLRFRRREQVPEAVVVAILAAAASTPTAPSPRATAGPSPSRPTRPRPAGPTTAA